MINGLNLPAAGNTGNQRLGSGGDCGKLGGHLCYSSSGRAVELSDAFVDFAGGFVDAGLHAAKSQGKKQGIIVVVELLNCRNLSFFAQDWPL